MHRWSRDNGSAFGRRGSAFGGREICLQEGLPSDGLHFRGSVFQGVSAFGRLPSRGSQQLGSTHPTGMHSCYKCVLQIAVDLWKVCPMVGYHTTRAWMAGGDTLLKLGPLLIATLVTSGMDGKQGHVREAESGMEKKQHAVILFII